MRASSFSSSMALLFHFSLLASKKRMRLLCFFAIAFASEHLAFHWSRLFSKNLTSFLLGLLYSFDSLIHDPVDSVKLWDHFNSMIDRVCLINCLYGR